MEFDIFAFIVIFKEISLAVAATVGIFVALNGLTTWKKELKAKAEYELSIIFLQKLYAYSNILKVYPIKSYSSPFILVSLSESELRKIFRDYGISELARYEEKLDDLKAAREGFDPYKLQAEAIWGKDIDALISPLFSMEVLAKISVNRFKKSVKRGLDKQEGEAINSEYDMLKKLGCETDEAICRREGLLRSESEEYDNYTKEIDQQIEKINNFFRPKLTI